MNHRLILKHYFDNNFEDLSITIMPGQMIAITGPIGKGKTKTIEILNNYAKSKNYHTKYIHDLNDFNNYTVEQTLKKNITTTTSEKQIKARIKRISKNIYLTNILNKRINSLTTGEKSKVKIASCLIDNPDYIFLDNPFIKLDPKEQIKIQEYLHKISAKGKNVIFTIQDLNQCINVDKIIIIDNYQIIANDTPKNIYNNQELLSKTDLRLPFTVELSQKLKYYGLLTKVVMDIDRMIDILWK